MIYYSLPSINTFRSYRPDIMEASNVGTHPVAHVVLQCTYAYIYAIIVAVQWSHPCTIHQK